MRIGCGGCLGAITLLVVVAAVLGGAGWAVMRAVERPPELDVVTTAEDGVRAQRKIYALYRSPRGRSQGDVVLSEREVNALLTRQLAEELPVSRAVARLVGEDRAEVSGRIAVDHLLGGLQTVRVWLPSAVREHHVWLRLIVRAQLVETPRREIRLVPERAAIGRLPVPAVLIRWLVEPAALRYLRWLPPEQVRGIRIEPGRVVIRVLG